MKATWNQAWQGAAFYQLACIDSKLGHIERALEHVNQSIYHGSCNHKAQNLKLMLLRKLNLFEEAKQEAFKQEKNDTLNPTCLFEIYLNEKESVEECNNRKVAFLSLIGNHVTTWIEVAIDYMEAGLFEDSIKLLKLYQETYETACSPLIFYYLGYCYAKLEERKVAKECLGLGRNACPDGCFPHRLEDIQVLEWVIAKNSKDSYAYYYLGNLWYDKCQYEKAISCFEISRQINGEFPTVHRNLALLYYNKRNDKDMARKSMERAFELDDSDARILMELHQLYVKIGISPQERKALLKKYWNLVMLRDDLYLEYITLENILGNPESAYDLLMHHKFHPWEGGEGKASTQYGISLMLMAKKAMARKDHGKAEHFLLEIIKPYPDNLSEGRLYGTKENHAHFYLGCVYEAQGKLLEAKQEWKLATEGNSNPSEAIYYNDQPPEMIFYQGLASEKLGEVDKATNCFEKLIAYGKEHCEDEIKIDYFAVSLPDFLIFEEDLKKKNQNHCYFMMALGYLGLKQESNYKKCKDMLLEADVNHVGIYVHER